MQVNIFELILRLPGAQLGFLRAGGGGHKIRTQLVSLLRPRSGSKNKLAGLVGTVSPSEGSGAQPGKYLKFDTFKHISSSNLSILLVIEVFEKMPNFSLRMFKFYWSRELRP